MNPAPSTMFSYRNLNKSNSDRPLPFPARDPAKGGVPTGRGGSRSGTAIGTRPRRPSLFGKRGCPQGDKARAQPLRKGAGRVKRVPIWYNIYLSKIEVRNFVSVLRRKYKILSNYKEALSRSDKNLVTRVSLVEEVSGVYPRNKEGAG